MPLEEFRQLFVKLPNSLSHVSFTVGDIAHNPSVLQILSYCVSNDYNPVNVSVTIVDADVTADVARQLTELCHSISVVRHPTNREQCYDAVAALSRFPQRPQTFLSVVFAHETVPFIIACLSDMRRDARLRGNVTALLLQLWRPKGKAALMELHLPTEDDLVQVLQQSRRCSAKIAYDADTGRNVFNFLTLSGATPFLLCQFEGCCSMRFSVRILTLCSVSNDRDMRTRTGVHQPTRGGGALPVPRRARAVVTRQAQRLHVHRLWGGDLEQRRGSCVRAACRGVEPVQVRQAL
eukprot:TRINITY_DN1352_c0_g1_i3.p1 TRINITY_DN1352_c0_g1~~TRINITY_DN1352_c0_g1_i3.p1  ORF type:complete len:293 (+),score=52.00 TRINITY_DN1352_c0_g1_i3:564-1442(+)